MLCWSGWNGDSKGCLILQLLSAPWTTSLFAVPVRRPPDPYRSPCPPLSTITCVFTNAPAHLYGEMDRAGEIHCMNRANNSFFLSTWPLSHGYCFHMIDEVSMPIFLSCNYQKAQTVPKLLLTHLSRVAQVSSAPVLRCEEWSLARLQSFSMQWTQRRCSFYLFCSYFVGKNAATWSRVTARATGRRSRGESVRCLALAAPLCEEPVQRDGSW